MATIEDLNFESFVDKSQDEAIEHLRQIRLSRRIPLKPKSSVKKKAKASSKAMPKLSAEQAKKLLEMIGE